MAGTKACAGQPHGYQVTSMSHSRHSVDWRIWVAPWSPTENLIPSIVSLKGRLLRGLLLALVLQKGARLECQKWSEHSLSPLHQCLHHPGSELLPASPVHNEGQDSTHRPLTQLYSEWHHLQRTDQPLELPQLRFLPRNGFEHPILRAIHSHLSNHGGPLLLEGNLECKHF